MERDKQLLARARDYMHALSEGRDPLTGRSAEGDSIVDEVRMRRCFAFVATYLQRELERTADAGALFLPSGEQLRELCSEQDVPLSEFYEAVAAYASARGQTPVSARSINHFLIRSGLAEGRVESAFVERRVLRATARAEEAGIYEKPRVSPRTGALMHTLMLTPEAQAWLLGAMPDIVKDSEQTEKEERE